MRKAGITEARLRAVEGAAGEDDYDVPSLDEVIRAHKEGRDLPMSPAALKLFGENYFASLKEAQRLRRLRQAQRQGEER